MRFAATTARGRSSIRTTRRAFARFRMVISFTRLFEGRRARKAGLPAVALLHGVLQVLHLAREGAHLLAQFIQVAGRAARRASRHRRMARATMPGFAGLAFSRPLVPLGLLAHLARNSFEVLRLLFHAGGAKMLDGLREMTEAGVVFGVPAGGALAAFARGTVVVMAGRRWTGGTIGTVRRLVRTLVGTLGVSGDHQGHGGEG